MNLHTDLDHWVTLKCRFMFAVEESVCVLDKLQSVAFPPNVSRSSLSGLGCLCWGVKGGWGGSGRVVAGGMGGDSV